MIYEYKFDRDQVSLFGEALELVKTCVSKFAKQCNFGEDVCEYINSICDEALSNIDAQQKKAFEALTGDELWAQIAKDINESMKWTTCDSVYSFIRTINNYLSYRLDSPATVEFAMTPDTNWKPDYK